MKITFKKQVPHKGQLNDKFSKAQIVYFETKYTAKIKFHFYFDFLPKLFSLYKANQVLTMWPEKKTSQTHCFFLN